MVVVVVEAVELVVAKAAEPPVVALVVEMAELGWAGVPGAVARVAATEVARAAAAVVEEGAAVASYRPLISIMFPRPEE
jgi:hypothetical protein